MPKSWFCAPAGGGSGSWRRRHLSLWALGLHGRRLLREEEIVIPSGDEEDQASPQQQPLRKQACLLSEVAVIDKEFVCRIELLTEQSLWECGTAPPSSLRAVKEELLSLPHYRVKQETTPPMQPMRLNRAPHEGGDDFPYTIAASKSGAT